MTQTTHTPGPWATDGRESAWDILDGDNNRIASVWRNAGKPQDARLIAAAPDLLAALAGLIEDCEAHGLTDNDAHLREARNAIIKAKGQ